MALEATLDKKGRRKLKTLVEKVISGDNTYLGQNLGV